MQQQWQRPGAFQLLLLVAALLLIANPTPGFQTAAAHEHNEGCSMHHPLVAKQQALLHRRLQQLRAAAAAAAAATAADDTTPKTKTSSAANTKQQQQQKVQAAEQTLQASSPTSSSSSSSSRGPKPPTAAVIRITPLYQLSGLSAADQRRVKQQLVPAAIKVLQRYVKVLRPSGGVLKLDGFFADGQQGCLTGRVDGQLAQGKAGIKDSDLLLYVTSDNETCLPGMIAMATACDVDPNTKRPILGSMNICGDALSGLGALKVGSEAEATALGRVVEVLVHETVHVLGFGSTHYEDWRGPNGKPYGGNNVVKNVDGRPYLATPEVTAVARKYFGCDKLPGAPLENEGPSFSSTSHFEYRLLQRELMSPARPIDRSRTRLSAFTLAALEDSGWYQTTTAAAEVLDWGRGAGCDFVLSSCWDFMDKHVQQPYYCGKGSLNQTRCTAEAAGWGVCRTNAFSDGCLLVGKYSLTAAAAVASGLPSSSEDGRQAACYSPPQLQTLNRGGPKGSLLPLLGGSYSAQRGDICYNLVKPERPPQRDDIVWVDGHGQIPEDVGKYPPSGSAGRRPPSQQQQQQQQQQRAGPNARAPASRLSSFAASPPLPFMDGGSSVREAAAAACVRVAAERSTSGGAAAQYHNSGKRLLSHIGALMHSNSSSSSRQLAAAAAGATTDGSTAACVTSPVLCFKSSCDSRGELWISVQHSSSGSTTTTSSSSSSSNGVGGSSRFACPAGQTVDLKRQLPGMYLSGYLQCPSNALVCETVGCGDCSPSGGYCSRGKCYCHMERFGYACKETLVPKLK